MRKIMLLNHLTEKQIKEQLYLSKSREQYQRWQVIYLVRTKQLKAQEIAEIVNVSRKTVYQWVYYYNKNGAKGLILKGKGGRRNAFLSLEEEASLVEKLTQQAKQGLVVIGKTVKPAVEKKVGHEVSIDYVYNLLHRHGWSKVSPRSKHPKSKLADQEEYKKIPELVRNAALSFGSKDSRPLKLLFMDEARFGRINVPVRCWTPAGCYQNS